MNSRFEVRWERDGVQRSKVIKGVGELSEFIRNSDAYERRIVSILPVD